MARRSHKASRRGQVVVVAPALLVILFLVLVMSVDLGYVCVTRARLQNAADAAAVAAAHVLLDERANGESEESARQLAAAEAAAIQQCNAEDAGMDVEFGSTSEAGIFTAEDDEASATAVRVTVRRNAAAPDGSLPLFFSPLVGKESCDVAALAICKLDTGIRGVLSGLRPFAIHEDDLVEPGNTMTFYEHETWGPGLFGLLNFDGGSCGTPELRDWILNGYDGTVEIDPEVGYTWIGGTPGWRATLKDEVQAVEGIPITVVVFDDVVGAGSNGNFRCIGFVAITITDSRLTGSDKYIACQVEEFTSVHDVLLGGGWSSPNMTKIGLAG